MRCSFSERDGPTVTHWEGARWGGGVGEMHFLRRDGSIVTHRGGGGEVGEMQFFRGRRPNRDAPRGGGGRGARQGGGARLRRTKGGGWVGEMQFFRGGWLYRDAPRGEEESVRCSFPMGMTRS